MLEKIAKLDAAVVKALLLAFAGLLGTLLDTVGLIDPNTFGVKAAAIVDAVSNFLIAVGLAWAMYARINLPTPPISDTAVAKTAQLMKKQGGFARAWFVALLLACSVGSIVALQGCSGTQHAFRAAETPDEKAFALLKLYEAAQSEALAIAQTPSTPATIVRALQQGAMRAKPAADTLRPLADAYKATGTATTEAELQAAYDRALIVINEFLSTVSNAKQVRP